MRESLLGKTPSELKEAALKVGLPAFAGSRDRRHRDHPDDPVHHRSGHQPRGRRRHPLQHAPTAARRTPDALREIKVDRHVSRPAFRIAINAFPARRAGACP